MTAFLIDPPSDRDDVLDNLYHGNLVVFTSLPSVAEYVEFTREQLSELFAPHDPEEAHLHYTPEEMAPLLGKWKPALFTTSARKGSCGRSSARPGRTGGRALRRAEASHRIPRRPSDQRGSHSPSRGTGTRGPRPRASRSTGGCRSIRSGSTTR